MATVFIFQSIYWKSIIWLGYCKVSYCVSFPNFSSTPTLILKIFFPHRDIRVSLTNQVEHMKIQYSGLTPHLTIVQVGSREDSNVYVRMKLKAAENIGIKTTHIHLPSSTNQTAVITFLIQINTVCFNVVY